MKTAKIAINARTIAFFLTLDACGYQKYTVAVFCYYLEYCEWKNDTISIKKSMIDAIIYLGVGAEGNQEFFI